MQLALRAMRATDVPRVVALDLAAFGPIDAWAESSFRDELRENRLARYYVLEDSAAVSHDAGPALRGYIGCWTMLDELHIVTIGVDPDWQQRGLGEALVQHALDLAHELGCEAVSLECRESNAAARALYAKYGFEQVGRRRRYYKDGEDALILTVRGIRDADYRSRLRLQRRALRESGLEIRLSSG